MLKDKPNSFGEIGLQEKRGIYGYNDNVIDIETLAGLFKIVALGFKNRQANKNAKRFYRDEKLGVRLSAFHFERLGKRSGREKLRPFRRSSGSDEGEPKAGDRNQNLHISGRENTGLERGETAAERTRQSLFVRQSNELGIVSVSRQSQKKRFNTNQSKNNKH